jgi:hypothetical protein
LELLLGDWEQVDRVRAKVFNRVLELKSTLSQGI